MKLLSGSQRAMAAARLASGRVGAPDLAEAAVRFNVSRRTVQHARRVLGHAVAGLVARVDEGTVKVSAAALVSRLSVHQQRRLVLRGPVAVREAATAIRKGLYSAG